MKAWNRQTLTISLSKRSIDILRTKHCKRLFIDLAIAEKVDESMEYPEDWYNSIAPWGMTCLVWNDESLKRGAFICDYKPSESRPFVDTRGNSWRNAKPMSAVQTVIESVGG